MRKFGVFLLSVILFFSLLSLAFSVSSNLAFTHPNKVKSWLNQSNLYGSFIFDAIKDAQQTDASDSNTVSLNNPEIQKIALSTFSSQALSGSVNTFVDSNYAWLEGKSNIPNFKIDLTSAKQTFAERVGDYVEAYMKNLSVCSDAQLSELSTQTTDPLKLPCRPPGVIPATVGAKVSEQIASNGAFLSDPVITASTLNPKGDSESQPYYESLSSLPQVYQFGIKLPLIVGLVALASMVGVIFIPKRHRNGFKVAGVVLALAGLVLVVTKLASDQIFNAAHQQVFNSNNTDAVQKALTAFLQHANAQLVKIDFWFGLAYLLAALIIFIVLRRTRQQEAAPVLSSKNTGSQTAPQAAPAPIKSDPDISLKPRPTAPTMRPTPKRRPQKPPRLVQ